MARLRTGEIPSQDISEITERRGIRATCIHCRQKQQKLHKIIVNTDSLGNENISRTKNEIGVCLNPECFRYTNLAIVSSWVTKESVF